jgi:Raf kinase inhibitor-like YbhB/YbcL family protein
MTSPDAGTPQIQLTSAAFAYGEKIPVRFTCEGDDVPDAPRGTWIHWVLYNLPGEAVELAQSVPTLPETPSGARHGRNTAGDLAYAGPCPPPGKPHRYFFRLYALDIMLSLQPGATRAELEEAMQQHILAQGTLMGTYQHRP